MDEEPQTGQEPLDRLNANIARMEDLRQRLMAALSRRRPIEPGLQGPGADLYLKAMNALAAGMMTNPARLMEHQVTYWAESLRYWARLQSALAQGQLHVPPDAGAPADRRFANPLWQTHPYFSFVRQQYQASARAIEAALSELDGLDEAERRRLQFFARQAIDLMSPANYLATNPDALQKAVETEGESLVIGLENLVRDIEANDGELLVTLSDPSAFEVGGNIAASEGKVVFRNHLFELIQYSPRTEQVHRTPLVIFPPWINKFYIMDLKPQNSLVRWIVDQGYTLFMVSWVNPDESHAGIGLEDYVRDGYLEAIRVAREITGEPQVNVVGYCIAGTTLALTLAHLSRLGEKPVRCATFFTALTDFGDVGEMEVFLEDDFVDAIEREVQERGVLHSFFMSRTFSFLRANDLVYAPAIRSYMMGEAPPAFDLLYWNGDSTNLPSRMVVEYLRWLCQENRLAEGRFPLFGQDLSLADVKLPLCAVACETDHIAPWDASFRGVARMGSRDRTFILSQSGHVAGVVNPPSKGKYGHYIGPDPTGTPEEWRAQSEFQPGSWWPRWEEWLRRRSGRMVPARQPGEGGYPALGPAPGDYVKRRSA